MKLSPPTVNNPAENHGAEPANPTITGPCSSVTNRRSSAMAHDAVAVMLCYQAGLDDVVTDALLTRLASQYDRQQRVPSIIHTPHPWLTLDRIKTAERLLADHQAITDMKTAEAHSSDLPVTEQEEEEWQRREKKQ